MCIFCCVFCCWRDARPSYRACEKLKASEGVEMRVVKSGRADGLREDQEQAIDGKKEEVKEQQSPEKQEVGEHSCSKTSTQFFHGWIPQLECAEDLMAAEEAMTPSLEG